MQQLQTGIYSTRAIVRVAEVFVRFFVYKVALYNPCFCLDDKCQQIFSMYKYYVFLTQIWLP